jgi:hypothetical protein
MPKFKPNTSMHGLGFVIPIFEWRVKYTPVEIAIFYQNDDGAPTEKTSSE